MFASALLNDPLLVRLPTKRAVFNARNKLHAFRAAQRRASFRHTGFHTSQFDPLFVSYREEVDQNLIPTGFWLLQISRSNHIEFELLSGLTPSPETSPKDHYMDHEHEAQQEAAEELPATQQEAPDGQESEEVEQEVQSEEDGGDDADAS